MSRNAVALIRNELEPAKPKPVRVMSSSGQVVELTRERCEALDVNGDRCRCADFRGADNLVLCWVHRAASSTRPLSLAITCERGARTVRL